MDDQPVILIIDHNTRNLELLRRFLCENGFRVQMASSLEEIDRVLQDTGEVRLAMVDTVGFDTGIWERCQRLRDAGVPFLVISPSQRVAYQEESLRRGTRGTLSKPLAQRELLVLLRSLLGETARRGEE